MSLLTFFYSTNRHRPSMRRAATPQSGCEGKSPFCWTLPGA